jgi:hypothetical protein
MTGWQTTASSQTIPAAVASYPDHRPSQVQGPSDYDCSPACPRCCDPMQTAIVFAGVAPCPSSQYACSAVGCLVAGVADPHLQRGKACCAWPLAPAWTLQHFAHARGCMWRCWWQQQRQRQSAAAQATWWPKSGQQQAERTASCTKHRGGHEASLFRVLLHGADSSRWGKHAEYFQLVGTA